MDDTSAQQWRQRFIQVLVLGSAIVVVLALSLAAVAIVLTGRLNATQRALDSAKTRIGVLEAEAARSAKPAPGASVTPPRLVNAPTQPAVRPSSRPAPPSSGPVVRPDRIAQSLPVVASQPAASRPQPAGDIEARRARGEQAVRRGDYASARTELAPVVAANPDDAEARLWLGSAFFHTDAFDEADRLFEWLTLNRQKSPDGFYWRGMIRLRRLEPDRALPFFDQAVAADPAFAPAWESAGIALANMGKLDEALQRLAEAARLSPRRAEIPFAQSVCYARLDARQDAIDALRRALALDPKLADRARATPALDRLLQDEDWQKLAKP